MDSQDRTVLGAIAAATGVSTAAGTITVMVTTTKILGITVATTTVALPVAGLVAAGGAATFGGYKMWKWLRSRDGAQTGNNPAPEVAAFKVVKEDLEAIQKGEAPCP
jgi:hypothetical protein